MMKFQMSLGWVMAALSLAAAQDDVKIEYKPLKFGGSQEFGSISSVVDVVVSTPEHHANEWVDHLGAYFIQEVTVEDRLDLSVGLGGVFQFPKPEKNRADFFGSQYKMFYVGPAVAQAVYKFGDPADPTFTLGGGMFPFKYNPEAVNLGEYLFRSTPYPSTLTTGGLNVVNDNAAHLQGWKGSLHRGGFRIDALLVTETHIPPLYDWSPAVMASYTSGDGLFTVGAGGNFKHLIQVKPSRTQRKVAANSYFTFNNTVYTGNSNYYLAQSGFYSSQGKDSLAAVWQARADLVDSLRTAGGGIRIAGADYYTPAGLILMARGALALNKLVRLPGSEEDLKLYFETALLGFKDYPFYYTRKTDRMPVMVGFNLPTLGALDLFAVQVEYFNSPNVNSYFPLADGNIATPYIVPGSLNAYAEKDYADATKEDNFSWSVLARKSLYKTFTISAQVARDHLRTVNADWWYSSKQEPNEVLTTSKEWYWMLQFGWNI
jgi:hypothetical protein